MHVAFFKSSNFHLIPSPFLARRVRGHMSSIDDRIFVQKKHLFWKLDHPMIIISPWGRSWSIS